MQLVGSWIKKEKEGGEVERRKITDYSAGSGSQLDSSADRFCDEELSMSSTQA